MTLLRKTMGAIATAMTVSGLAAGAHAATFNVTLEAPGVENSTASFSSKGIETFDSLSTGTGKTVSATFGGTGITGTYTNLQVNPADKFGGAGGVGNYAVTFSKTGYSLDLTTSDPDGINYFGFWLSALDAGNDLAFYKAGVLQFSFDQTDVLAQVGSNSAYFGNPNAAFAGQNSAQPYAFLNFFDTSGTFDEVVFTENPSDGGYESDNHTVGFFTKESGTPVGVVPEPAGWALMVGGFGLAGAALRRRREPVAA